MEKLDLQTLPHPRLYAALDAVQRRVTELFGLVRNNPRTAGHNIRRILQNAEASCAIEASHGAHSLMGSPRTRTPRSRWSCFVLARLVGLGTDVNRMSAVSGSMIRETPFVEKWCRGSILSVRRLVTGKRCRPYKQREV